MGILNSKKVFLLNLFSLILLKRICHNFPDINNTQQI